jgi:hypothetical protein
MSRLCVAALVAMTLNAGGCILLPSYDPGKVDLKKYDRLVIVPFSSAPEASQFSKERNDTLCATIKKNAVKSGSQLFTEIVVASEAKHESNNLILTGTVKQYDPGNQFARAMLIGLGSATFKIDVCLIDGASGECLCTKEVSSLFVLGGLIGGAVSEQNFVDDLGGAIGKGVTLAKREGP